MVLNLSKCTIYLEITLLKMGFIEKNNNFIKMELLVKEKEYVWGNI